MKNNIVTVIIIVAVLTGFYFLISQKPTKTENIVSNTVTPSTATSPTTIPTVYPNPDLTLYWGEGCPHCENVKEYIKTNQVDQKLKINQKEVYRDQNNSNEFKKNITDYCSDLITQGGIGVPVLFDSNNKKCYQGDTPIINYLLEKTK